MHTCHTDQQNKEIQKRNGISVLVSLVGHRSIHVVYLQVESSTFFSGSSVAAVYWFTSLHPERIQQCN